MSTSRTRTTKYSTREAWLTAAINAVRPMFATAGYPLPRKVRVSVGFGYNSGAENKHILAQAWANFASADGTPAVFISPVIADAVDAFGALMHELVHVADNCESGHRGTFVKIGEAIGLEGKPTQMLPGIVLEAQLVTIVASIGTYPHAALHVGPLPQRDTDDTGTIAPARIRIQRVHTGPAAQSNRHFKAECHNTKCSAEGYLIRTSQKWLTVATPICPVCRKDMHVS